MKASSSTANPPLEDGEDDGADGALGLGVEPDWLDDPPLGFEAGFDAGFDGNSGFLFETTGLSGFRGATGAGGGLRGGAGFLGGGRLGGHQPPDACWLKRIIPASTTSIIAEIRFIS